MKSQHKILQIMTWLLSGATLLWALWMLNGNSRYLRTQEFTKNFESLSHLASLLPKDSHEQKAVEQSAKNFEGLADGAQLLEERGLHVTAFLALLSLSFASMSLLSQILSPSMKNEETEAPADGQNAEWMLAQTLEDLARIKVKIAQAEAQHKLLPQPKPSLEHEGGELVAMESQLVFIKNQVDQLVEHNSQALDDIRQLTVQADGFASYANASRLEWNALSIKLSQFKEAQGQIRGKVEMLMKNQSAAQEVLTRALEFHKIHGQHAERASTDLRRMYAETKSTTEVFGHLIQAMSESRDNVDLSNKLVRRLSERAEEIVNIIDVIDDIAEQTNQLALNASIEAARAGEQGKGFAVVAGEVRSLAARSSTATRTITELLETIQTEANQASISLEKTNGSVGSAHARIQDVEYRCRETMNLSHKSGSEMSDLIQVATEHNLDIQAVEKQCGEVSRMTQSLLRSIDEIDQLNSSVHQESSQLAVHTDRISRLMTRHYFAIQHGERVCASQKEGLQSLGEASIKALTRAQGLRGAWDDRYRQLISLTPAPTEDHAGADSASELARLMTFCQSNLELLRARKPMLTLVRNQGTEGINDDISLATDDAPRTSDDGDISLHDADEKAS